LATPHPQKPRAERYPCPSALRSVAAAPRARAVQAGDRKTAQPRQVRERGRLRSRGPAYGANTDAPEPVIPRRAARPDQARAARTGGCRAALPPRDHFGLVAQGHPGGASRVL